MASQFKTRRPMKETLHSRHLSTVLPRLDGGGGGGGGSGHCHLLQDYKHRVFGEPSDICTDCGASLQDVRHPVRSAPHTRLTCHQSYLDNGNLD